MNKENTIRVLKIEPGRVPEEVDIPNTLEALQEAVDGYIEAVSLDLGVSLVCNSEGKLLDLPGNRRVGMDIIAGTFLIVGTRGEDFSSLSQGAMKKFQACFATPELFEPGEPQKNVGITFHSFG